VEFVSVSFWFELLSKARELSHVADAHDGLATW
jgi:hypothetical protein